MLANMQGLLRTSWLIGLVVCGACGGGDGGQTDSDDGSPATDDGSSGSSSSTDDNSTGGGSTAGSEVTDDGTTTDDGTAGGGASDDGSAASNDDPSAADDSSAGGGVAVATFAPGTPETLVDGLDFAGRFVVDGNVAYVANRASYRLDGSSDQMLRVDLNTGTSTVLFESSSINTFALIGNQLCIADTDSGAFTCHDKMSGVEISRFEQEGWKAYAVTGDASELFYVVSNSGDSAILRTAADGTGGAVFWEATEPVYPSSLRLTGDTLFGIANGTSAAGERTSRLMNLPRNGDAPVILATSDYIGGYAWAGSDFIYTNYSESAIERVPSAGGTPQSIASVPSPWGIGVEGDSAYVTTQPEFYCETPSAPSGELYHVDLSSGEATLLADELPCPSQVHLTASSLLWVNNGFATPSAEGLVSAQESTGLRQIRSLTSLGGSSLMRLTR